MQNTEGRIPNSGELHAIEYLCCLDKQLTDAQGPLKDWLQQIPNGWRDFRMVQSVTEKLIGKLYETLPDKTMRHIISLANHGQIVIRPRPAIPLNEKTQFMTDEDLTMLVNTVIENQCAMCVNDAQAQKKCKLRKTLENVAPTEAVHRNGLCSYRDVVCGNPLGDYVQGGIMTYKEMIAVTGEEYMLRQMAEECCELSQAALKLVRALNAETPVSVPKARQKLVEELADVKIMFNIVYGLLSDAELSDYDSVLKYKKDRFSKRLKAKQNPA